VTVRTAFIEPMLRNFDEPSGVDAAGFFADLEDDLCAYDDELLHEAYLHIRRTYKFRKFPTIAQCLAACREVPRPSAQAVPQTQQVRDEIADKVRRRYRACAMIRDSDLGREALDGRWLGGLIDFVADEQRLPDDNEIRVLQWQRDSIERNLEQIREAPFDPQKPQLYAPLMRLRRAMLRGAEREVYAREFQAAA
jgi:hypothetical protein